MSAAPALLVLAGFAYAIALLWFLAASPEI
jgi:hypothetical protein